jgi:hypothetical protein
MGFGSRMLRHALPSRRAGTGIPNAPENRSVKRPATMPPTAGIRISAKNAHQANRPMWWDTSLRVAHTHGMVNHARSCITALKMIERSTNLKFEAGRSYVLVRDHKLTAM